MLRIKTSRYRRYNDDTATALASKVALATLHRCTLEVVQHSNACDNDRARLYRDRQAYPNMLVLSPWELGINAGQCSLSS